MKTSIAFDLIRARRETPGCEQVIHFNNAGAGLMPEVVLNTMVDHLRLEARTGGYEAAEEAYEAVNSVYLSAANFIGARWDEIALVENATRAWDMAFYSLKFNTGDRILTGRVEYASNYIAFLQKAKSTGVIIEAIPNDEFGQVSLNSLENMIDDRVKLIAITHVPTNGGLVNPAEEIGKIARRENILYLLDACQSVGQMPVDVNEIGCDILSTTGRKYLRGPRGIGFLYVRKDLIDQLEPPMLDLHAARWVAQERYEIIPDARRFENWERSYASLLGLGAAIEYARSWDIKVTWERIQALAAQLRTQLSEVRGIVVRDLGLTRCGIVTFTLEGKEPEEIKGILRNEQINISTSSIFSTRLDMEARQLTGLVRASVHYYNSEAEIDRFCEVLLSIVEPV